MLSDDIKEWFDEGEAEVLHPDMTNHFHTAEAITAAVRFHGAEVEWDFFTAPSGEHYEGHIHRFGRTLGYVGLGEDGKAMVWNPKFPLDDNRVVFPSGVPAGWSNDDAVEMIDVLLLGTQGQKIDMRCYQETPEPKIDLPLAATAADPEERVMVKTEAPEDPVEALSAIRHFLSREQARTMRDLMDGEEGPYFQAKAREIAGIILGMPKTHETANDPDPVAYLHYFNGGSDWYVFERDMYEEQLQAYCYACLNGWYDSAEVGLVSIEELCESGVELDLHWTPRPLSEVKEELRQRYEPAAPAKPRCLQMELIDAVEDLGFNIALVGPGRMIFGRNGSQVLMTHDDACFTIHYGEEGRRKGHGLTAEDALEGVFGPNCAQFEEMATKSDSAPGLRMK
jgi:hypothetical protein